VPGFFRRKKLQEKSFPRTALYPPGRIDNPEKEWSYLLEPTTVIGMPFSTHAVQVTYDGSIFTGSGELCFFYGKDNTPLFARQRYFLKGWIPVVMYSWEEREKYRRMQPQKSFLTERRNDKKSS